MALNVVQYEDLVALLRQVAPLVDKLEARGFGFSDDVLAWLKQVEVALESNRLPAVSQVAALRSLLIEAARGIHGNELAIVGRPTLRKIQEGTASLVLQRGNDLLHAVIAERQAAFQEAERIARQVVAVAEAKGLLRACAAEGGSHQGYLDCVREQVAADSDLASISVHLVALVGKADVLIFLDRALASLA